MHYTVSK